MYQSTSTLAVHLYVSARSWPTGGWSIQVLPILSVSGVDDAIAKTNQICSQPLALYVYAEDQGVIDKYVRPSVTTQPTNFLPD